MKPILIFLHLFSALLVLIYLFDVSEGKGHGGGWGRVRYPRSFGNRGWGESETEEGDSSYLEGTYDRIKRYFQSYSYYNFLINSYSMNNCMFLCSRPDHVGSTFEQWTLALTADGISILVPYHTLYDEFTFRITLTF